MRLLFCAMRLLRAHPVWGLIAVGTALRVVLAATTHGLPYDVESWNTLRAAFAAHPLHVYTLANPGGNFHWPYPPGFLPLMLVSSGISDLVGWGFTHVVRGPSIVADAVLTWLVWKGLAGRVAERTRLLAAGAVALGPVFITISGYAAQIDSVAILPAVAALLVFERVEGPRRAWIAGALVGLAASVKTVPLVMIFALAPSARSLREVAILLGSAVAVLFLSVVPFLIADEHGLMLIRHYAGSPGMGGLSLVLQPDLAARWLNRWVVATPIEQSLFINHAGAYNALVVAAYAVYAWRWRPAPRLAAALLWLVVVALGSGFFFQYLVWGLPFFLLAGFVRATIVLQLVITVPMLIYFLGPWHDYSIVYVYVPFMILVWLGWVVGAAVLARGGMLTRRERLAGRSALA